jgi:hypothetical protein
MQGECFAILTNKTAGKSYNKLNRFDSVILRLSAKTQITALKIGVWARNYFNKIKKKA